MTISVFMVDARAGAEAACPKVLALLSAGAPPFPAELWVASSGKTLVTPESCASTLCFEPYLHPSLGSGTALAKAEIDAEVVSPILSLGADGPDLGTALSSRWPWLDCSSFKVLWSEEPEGCCRSDPRVAALASSGSAAAAIAESPPPPPPTSGSATMCPLGLLPIAADVGTGVGSRHLSMLGSTGETEASLAPAASKVVARGTIFCCSGEGAALLSSLG